MANEFKIKNGLILGPSNSKPVTSISDSSTFSYDASALLTENAMQNHLESNYVPTTGGNFYGALNIDASVLISESLFISSLNLGQGSTYLVTSISDSSTFNYDPSSLLTENAIQNHLETNYVPVSGGNFYGALNIDASVLISEDLFISSLNLGESSTHNVNFISNDSTFTGLTDSSTLATVSAIKGYISTLTVDASIVGLSDTSIGNELTYDRLEYDASSSKWINKQNEWKTDSSTVQLVNAEYDLQLNAIEIEQNSGEVVIIDMDVTTDISAGVDQSYTFNLGGTNFLKIFGTSKTGGGVNSESVKVIQPLIVESSVNFTGISEQILTKTLYYNSTSGEVFYGDVSDGGGGGATTFITLTDAPSSYSGQGLKMVRVNSGASALEFSDDYHTQAYIDNSLGTRDTSIAWLNNNKLDLTGGVISGTLTVDGSLYIRNAESIDVSSSFINLNTGQTGSPASSMQSGVIVERGDLNPYVFLYDETDETFRIGIAPLAAGPSFDDSSTQAVATREDTPASNSIAYWNSTLDRFDTSTSLNFSSNTLNIPKILNIDTSLSITNNANQTLYKFGSDTHLSVTPINTTLFGSNSSVALNPGSVTIDSSTIILGDLDDGNSFITIRDTNSSPNPRALSIYEPSSGSNILFEVTNEGILYCPSLNENTASKLLYFNQVTGEVSYQDPPAAYSAFTSLSDTPGSYSGEGLKMLRVNSAANAVEFSSDYHTQSYIDGSLSERDTSINWLNNNKLSNTPSNLTVTNDVSIGSDLYVDGSVITLSYQYMGAPDVNGSWRFYVSQDASSDMVFEKRVGGTWTEGGRFTI